MTAVVKSSSADGDMTSLLYANQIADLIAGEALTIASPCYIDATDGKAYMSNGTAADASAKIDGFTVRPVASGEPCTLFGVGARFKYSDALLTPGATYYLGTADGGLDTAATTGDAVGVAQAINTNDLRVVRDNNVI